MDQLSDVNCQGLLQLSDFEIGFLDGGHAIGSAAAAAAAAAVAMAAAVSLVMKK